MLMKIRNIYLGFLFSYLISRSLVFYNEIFEFPFTYFSFFVITDTIMLQIYVIKREIDLNTGNLKNYKFQFFYLYLFALLSINMYLFSVKKQSLYAKFLFFADFLTFITMNLIFKYIVKEKSQTKN